MTAILYYFQLSVYSDLVYGHGDQHRALHLWRDWIRQVFLQTRILQPTAFAHTLLEQVPYLPLHGLTARDLGSIDSYRMLYLNLSHSLYGSLG